MQATVIKTIHASATLIISLMPAVMVIRICGTLLEPADRHYAASSKTLKPFTNSITAIA
jgi:hypothetical protein